MSLLIDDVPRDIAKNRQLVVLALIRLNRGNNQENKQNQRDHYLCAEYGQGSESASRFTTQTDRGQGIQNAKHDAENNPQRAEQQCLHRMEFQQPAGLLDNKKDQTQNDAEAATNHRQITNH